MTIEPGDVIRISARQEMQQSQDHVSVFHYLAVLADDQTDEDMMDLIAEEIDLAFSTIQGFITTGQEVLDMKFDIVEFQSGVEKIIRNVGLMVWPDGVYEPAGTGEVLPPGVCALVKFLTSIGKVYGRKFLGGLIETAQNAGWLESNVMTAMANFGAVIMSRPEHDVNNGYDAGVMSIRQAAFVPFAEYDVSNNVAYQRRRRTGTGS